MIFSLTFLFYNPIQQFNKMSNQSIMLKELAKNENSQILKQAIQMAAKAVEQRVYWLNTSEMEGDFLQQYWEKQVPANHILKKRIQQITQQKFNQLFAEVDQGKVNPAHQLEVLHIGNLNLSVLAQQIPIYDSSYFSQDHPKTKQTKAKIKQIQEDYHKFKEKIQEIKRKQQQKKLQKAAAQQQLRQSIQKQKKQRYRQLVMKTIQQKNKKQQQRKIQNQKFKQYLKVYKGSKPLHVLMEQQYKQKFELPLLEQNKRKLEQYRQKVKPTLEQINEHQRSYMQAKQSKEKQSRIYMPNKTIDVSFKSKFYLAEQQKMNGGDHAYETLFDQMEKKKRYSELVKENFKPKISVKLRNSINESQLQKTTAKQSLDRTAQIEKGKAYLQFMRSLQKNRKQHSSPSQRGQNENETPRYTNYLQALKQSRQIQGNSSRLSNDWERDAKNKSLSEYERRERILMKSKQLQMQAQRKQQFVNNFNYGKAEQIIQRKKQIDDTLISSIRAKVAVLKQAHQV